MHLNAIVKTDNCNLQSFSLTIGPFHSLTLMCGTFKLTPLFSKGPKFYILKPAVSLLEVLP